MGYLQYVALSNTQRNVLQDKIRSVVQSFKIRSVVQSFDKIRSVSWLVAHDILHFGVVASHHGSMLESLTFETTRLM